MSKNNNKYRYKQINKNTGRSKNIDIEVGSSTNIERAYLYDDRVYVKPPYGRDSYERFRPMDKLPTSNSEIMRACRAAYEKVGIIRSVIDLMTEIAIEDFSLVSDHEPTENFYRNWAKKVNLENRVEAFANYALVEGNIAVRRMMGSLKIPELRRMRQKSFGEKDNNIEEGTVPLKYIFYDPSTLELIGEEVASLSTEKSWGIRISAKNVQKLLTLSSKAGDSFIEGLPEELRKFIKSGAKYTKTTLSGDIIIPIPTNRLYVAHYKKRDTDVWAKSFIYSILHDVMYNEKLRVAKISTLDSWNNSVRIWKIGDHEAGILPSSDTFSELASVLQNNSGAGGIELIWDSLIHYEQHYPPIDKLVSFEENFESILVGLGVHRSLVGGSESSNAAASAFVGLRNMMKRIDGVRRLIKSWIENEIDIISSNMGFRHKPKIKFSLTNLFDQQSYFKLLTELVDRDIVSDHTVLEKIGEIPDIEKNRVKRENEQRNSGLLPEKKGQYIQPTVPESNFKKDKEKLKISKKLNNTTTPTNTDTNSKSIDPLGKAGRPVGSKDTVKRNRRYRTKAEALITASKIQDKLDDIFDKEYLVYNNISNKRQLSSEDRANLENGKLSILPCLEDDNFSDIADVESAINNADKMVVEEFNKMFKEYTSGMDNSLTLQEKRSIAALIYSEIYGK